VWCQVYYETINKITETGGFFKASKVVDIAEATKIPLLVGSICDKSVATAGGGILRRR
jgi:hypothetical protein